MCLAQGHNAVTPVRLEPAALQSRVKHSTTEPLRSLDWGCVLQRWHHELVVLFGWTTATAPGSQSVDPRCEATVTQVVRLVSGIAATF